MVDRPALTGDPIRRVREQVVPGVPHVDVGEGRGQDARAHGADHQRRSPAGLRQQDRIAGRMPTPREGHPLPVQQPSDDLEGLLEPRPAMVERDPEGIELRTVPAGPHPKDQAAVAHLIDRGGDLGEHRRRVEVETGDEGAQPHAARDGGEAGEERPGLPGTPLGAAVPSVQVMVADPDRVEPHLLRRQRHGHVLGPPDLAFDLGKLDAESGSR